MSERIKGVVITFSDDMHEEDVDVIVAAFSAFRCVASVAPCTVNFEDTMNRERVRTELRAKLLEALK